MPRLGLVRGWASRYIRKIDSPLGGVEGDSMEPRVLLENWLERVQVAQSLHYRSSVLYARANYYVGIPVVVLSTIAGSSVFAAINQKEQNVWATMLIGSLSL